jgi:hypothetical protein
MGTIVALSVVEFAPILFSSAIAPSSAATTVANTPPSTGSSGGIPEFPFQIGLVAAFLVPVTDHSFSRKASELLAKMIVGPDPDYFRFAPPGSEIARQMC